MTSFSWSAEQAAAAARRVDDTDVADDLEEVEAITRRLMAEHKAIEARGFDSTKRRAAIHRRVDALLDEWSLLGGVVPPA